MAQRKKYSSNIDAKKYFRSPLFLIAAILISLIPVAIIARIWFSGVGIVLLLGLIFSIISTVFVWMVYAGKSEIKKVKKFCRIMSYTRLLSTLVTIGFIALASILVIGLFIGAAAGSAGLYDFAETLENQVKPFIQGMKVPDGEFDEFVAQHPDAFASSNILVRGFWIGVNDVADLRAFMDRWSVVSSYLVIVVDGAIALAKNNLWVFTLITTFVMALIATAMCFVNSALKKTVRQLQILSVGINGFRKSHALAICIGGTALVLTGLAMVFFEPILAVAPLLLGSVLYVFAMIFSDVNYEKNEEEKGFIEADEISEAAKITV